ncbi:DUF2683 family protein [Flavobacterium sp. ov086]|uniref:DUF2683 family protein n=1 Tax=Flavobacterium sp. ov086 TaxID=1761785 RepID=UPI000B72BCA2|nr:DUF2683 family protein [Flavobacterium sp. ov086]SNR64471.1 hypothetical protein SAMN04487979_11513 [Flavobacterium sp. ov086]
MITITIDEETEAGKTFLEIAKMLALKYKGIKIDEENSYNREFVKKIEESYDDYKSGKSKSITVDTK